MAAACCDRHKERLSAISGLLRIATAGKLMSTPIMSLANAAAIRLHLAGFGFA
jgi:hypothetical protein